ncbi:MAG: rhomboid family intramembrane serine protease [Brucellaceae bacterium]|nr:rhomboid family intramembrane serine protease [Brucellaceae bacterium]
MFIPLHDANSLKHVKLQYVTFAIIAINVVVFLVTSLQSVDTAEATVLGLGYIPSTVFNVIERPDELVIVPDNLTYITYAFLHGDIFHLGGNMLFLWVFGDNVEDALGHVRYLVFYLLCAVAGAFMHGIVEPGSTAPLIGASGAIAGIVAAYLMLHPRVKIWILAFGRIPLRIPAYITLTLWILFQFAMMLAGGEDQVSWAAHVGGIVAGAVLVLFMRRRGVPLFDAEVVTPKAVETAAPDPAATGAEPDIVPRWGRQ